MLSRDQRSLFGGRIERVADPQRARLRHQALLDLFVHGALHQDARAAQADLSLVLESGARGLRHGFVEIGVGEEDVGILPSHLERHLDEALRGLPGDLAPDARRAGEADGADVGMGDERTAGARSETLHDVQHARRQSRLAA